MNNKIIELQSTSPQSIKLQIVSDIHLDQIKLYSNERLVYPDGDILVLGGDICHISTVEKHRFFFRYLSENFQYIIYVPGNHEFYNDDGTSLEESERIIKKFLKTFDNFIYLNDESVVIENLLITGSCFWNEPETLHSWFKINIDSKKVCEMHQKSVKYLESIESFKNYGLYKHIIITHYPPKNVLEKIFIFSDQEQSKCENNLNICGDQEILKVWVSGHTHQNFSFFENDTLYLSNQRKGSNYSNSVLLKILS